MARTATAATGSKRKRKADKAASLSPGKRPSSEKKARTASVRVEVCPNDPAHDPVVVSFPRGVPHSLAPGDAAGGGAAPPRFASAALRPGAKHPGRRVAGEDAQCRYSAAAVGRGHDGRLTKAYVCVYDKKARTLRLVPAAERGTVFALDQAVKGYAPNVAHGSAVVGGAEEGALSAMDRVQLLVDSFGSKKKQKVMASRAANKVNIHRLVGSGDAMMANVTKQEGISLENKKRMEEGSAVVDPNDVAYAQARQKMLPPYDAQADKPGKVYNAQAIAGPVAWDKASRIVDKVLAKAAGAADFDYGAALLGAKGSPAVVELLNSIDPAKKSAPYRLKAAFFLGLALKFRHKLQRRGCIEGASLDDAISGLFLPPEVGARLFDLFTSAREGRDGREGGYVASQQQQSKMAAHLLVLYVIANGRDMKAANVAPVCKEMGLDGRDAALVLREAGFTVKKNGAKGMAVSLAVPLKFPPPKRGKRT